MMQLQSTYKHNEKKVILTEECFKRLQEIINLTRDSMKNVPIEETPNGGYEYLTILFGKVNENGDYVFSTPSVSKYDALDGQAKPSDEIIDELLRNLLKSEFNCFTYIHTHPYGKTESSRIFSERDIDSYRTTYKSSAFSKAYKKEITFLGGLLTISEENTPQTDDISFVYYNEENDEMEYLPNIYICNDDRLIALKSKKETIYFDAEDNRIYNKRQLQKGKKYIPCKINRIYLENDEKSKSRL